MSTRAAHAGREETSRTGEWMDSEKEKEEKPDHLFILPLPSLFLCLYARPEKCELSMRGRGWGVKGGREGELEGGGRTHDTMRRDERRKVRQRGKGRTGNI